MANLISSEPSRFLVDGLEPRQVWAPASRDEIGELLKKANAEKWAVVPFGSGSKQHIGNVLKKFDVALSMENFAQIPEYEPQDLVVKVESGCRLLDLQTRLAQDQLCLPVDPASGERATLGGIVSCHDSGPLRFSQGTIRDHLIGISVVQPVGTWTKFGSRVVKNVTGYDMCKLYTGAFGTLGVLVDFFFKLRPLPPSEKTVIVTVRGLPEVWQAVSWLTRSPLVPVALEFLNPSAVQFMNESLALTRSHDGYLVAVRFGDVEKAVQWQIEQLEKLWEGLATQGIIVSDAGEQKLLWQLLSEDRAWVETPQAVKMKVNFLPSRLVETVQSLESLAKSLSAQLRIKGHAGNGIVRAYLRFEESVETILQFTTQLQRIRSLLKSCRGSVVVESAPLEVKKVIDVWGYDFKDKALMQQIRQQFDPCSVLNPGRFVV
jgi:glycolate oxidase FAD binding subunit